MRRNNNDRPWGHRLITGTLLACTPLLAWSLSPWGPRADVIPDALATITSIQVPTQITDTLETISRLRDGVQDIGTIEDRMTEQVAEQCAVIIASGMDDECVIRVATAAEELTASRRLLDSLED